MDESNHAGGERHSDHPSPNDDVKIEELSESRLRITVGRLVSEVTIQKIYLTDRSFGQFQSLDGVIAYLRKKSEEAE